MMEYDDTLLIGHLDKYFLTMGTTNHGGNWIMGHINMETIKC